MSLPLNIVLLDFIPVVVGFSRTGVPPQPAVRRVHMSHLLPWLDSVWFEVRNWFHALVEEHIVAEDPWDPETVLGGLSEAR
jgi:hypothetical protein